MILQPTAVCGERRPCEHSIRLQLIVCSFLTHEIEHFCAYQKFSARHLARKGVPLHPCSHTSTNPPRSAYDHCKLEGCNLTCGLMNLGSITAPTGVGDTCTSSPDHTSKAFLTRKGVSSSKYAVRLSTIFFGRPEYHVQVGMTAAYP